MFDHDAPIRATRRPIRAVATTFSRDDARRQWHASLALVTIIAAGSAFVALQTILTILR